MPRIDFYFDYLSPYAYLAWVEAHRLQDKLAFELCPKPILFAGLLNHWGQLGPAEIEPKRVFVVQDCHRYAATRDIPFRLPPHHPFNPLLALRVTLAIPEGPKRHAAIHALWQGCWADGRDLGDKGAVAQILSSVGEDGPARVAEATQHKDALRTRTEAAVRKGIFGVPTLVVGDTLLWGKDQMTYLEACLLNADPLPAHWAEENEACTASANRRSPR